MNEKEAKELAVLIVLGAVTLWIIVLQIRIGIIHAFQNLFWVALVLAPLFLLVSIIFLIWGVFKKDEPDNWGFYSQPEFFERGVIFIFALVFFVLFFVSIVLVPYSYNRGYSNEALQRLAEYENQLQSLQQIQDILTGQMIWDIQNQVIEETIDNLCKDPNYPCENVKQSYQVYKDIKGAKDDADEIANFFGIIEKYNSQESD